MKTISYSRSNRPLLVYARVFNKHQHLTVGHQQTQAPQICLSITKKLRALQDTYETLPGKQLGKWFLNAGCQDAEQNLRNRCASLNKEINDIRSLFEPGNDETTDSSLSVSLEELSSFLETAANDLSCMTQRVNVTEPKEPTKSEKNSAAEITQSIEA